MITTQNSTIVSNHGIAEVWFNQAIQHHSLHASKVYNAGEFITPFFAGVTQDFATYLTLQTGLDTHITLQPDFLQFVNHSCNPNTFFDTTVMQFISIKAIQKQEQFTFFYPSTEWNMSQPFSCMCGSDNCLKVIRGAKYIDKKILDKYCLSAYITHQLNNTNSQ